MDNSFRYSIHPSFFRGAALRCVALFGVACLTLNSLACKAPTAPDAGFVTQPELLKQDDKLPFDAVWMREGTDLRSYKKVYVAPIDTTHLLKLDLWDKINLAPGDQAVQAGKLATYFQEKVKDAFTNDDKKLYQVVDTPDDETVTVELALVEVVPTKVWLNLIGYAALGALSQGATAFEGRLREAKSNQVIAEFKDQEYGQFDVVSARDLTWFMHSEHTMRQWSEELVAVFERMPDQAVAPMSTVTLKPW
jgi:hypothetical protein